MVYDGYDFVAGEDWVISNQVLFGRDILKFMVMSVIFIGSTLSKIKIGYIIIIFFFVDVRKVNSL